ncbi:hypothetical protein Q5P01_025073 [Channa striata]|uniref:ATPase AAA-type core domain-containing protein n=1 Tax=Channa striata TaxID=64152 RepID=A0AA88II12_CHASR|nr:hypothetical protein Q5P01_025073 [Channa striata]
MSFPMRNKLKRRKTREDTVTRAMTRESSCSEDAQSAEGACVPPSAEDGCGSNAAAAAADSSASKVQPVQEEKRRRCVADNVRIAPIFLRTTQRGMRKCSKEGQKSAPPAPGGDSERLGGEQPSSPSPSVCHRIEKEGALPGTLKGRLSPSSLHICLAEIQTSSPTFPVQAVFSTLQRKASCSPHDLESTGDIKQQAVHGTDHCHVPAQNVLESIVLPVKTQSRSSRLSRTHRLRQQNLVSNGEVKSEGRDHTASDRQSPRMCDTLKEVSSIEDVLWTDKYSPQSSSEVIGNSLSVNKLYSWLKKWKLRADSDERRKMEGKKKKKTAVVYSWDCGDFQGEAGADEDREETLCNTMLITGPPGVGKTASVYACTRELGFKIFEVNSSAHRSGCHVLSQLKEATQSHLVETPGTDLLKPTYFKNYTNNCPTKSETSVGKTVHPKNIISHRKKRAARKPGRKSKSNPTTVTLANYFKMKVKADRLHFGGLSPSKKPDAMTLGNPSPSCDQTEPRGKKAATSLILFEEVDVIFDHDVGFLAAIKTFMTTTKRPVILTTNDPTFRERFCCSLEEIIFKTPSVVSLCSYLQLVGLAENVQLELNDVRSLLGLTQGDVRRCLLQLQLWVHSGGGQPSQSGGFIKEPTCKDRGLELQLPPREAGCSASMLGLTHMTQIQLLKHLKSQYWSETDMNKFLMLLTESWRRCVPLLYSNLELLLPIGAEGTSVHCLGTMTSDGMHNERASSDSSKASAIHCKYVKGYKRKISRLSRRTGNTMFDTTSSSTFAQRISLNGDPSTAPGSSDRTEQKADKVEINCLVALADFFDAMSYLDATLSAAGPLVSGPCRPEAFGWTGAEIKEGLLDEMSQEESWSCSQERLFNIQACVEGLAFHMCCWRLSESWTRAKKYTQETEDKKGERLVERRTLPAASKRQSISFTVQPLCSPSVSQRRYELSRKVFGSEYFSLLGNRQAVSVDYLPVLRAICRYQRAEQQKEEPLRYLNYFSNTNLGLLKSTMTLLAEDFS